MDLPPPRLELLAHDREVRKPEDEARAELFVDPEKLEVSAERAMVAPLDLLELLQILVELFLGRPHRAVDPLELRVALVAAPVRPGDGEQLERADLTGSFHVRSAAEVDEVAVLVDGDLAVPSAGGVVLAVLSAELLDLFDLVVLTPLREEPDRVRSRHLAMLEGEVARDRGAHPLLDPGQVLIGERPRKVEVVVEAIGDRRAEAELRLREELQDRTGHNVRGRMPERIERLVTVI